MAKEPADARRATGLVAEGCDLGGYLVCVHMCTVMAVCIYSNILYGACMYGFACSMVVIGIPGDRERDF